IALVHDVAHEPGFQLAHRGAAVAAERVAVVALLARLEVAVAAGGRDHVRRVDPVRGAADRDLGAGRGAAAGILVAVVARLARVEVPVTALRGDDDDAVDGRGRSVADDAAGARAAAGGPGAVAARAAAAFLVDAGATDGSRDQQQLPTEQT